jgi:hypothetical protein
MAEKPNDENRIQKNQRKSWRIIWDRLIGKGFIKSLGLIPKKFGLLSRQTTHNPSLLASRIRIAVWYLWNVDSSMPIFRATFHMG